MPSGDELVAVRDGCERDEGRAHHRSSDLDLTRAKAASQLAPAASYFCLSPPAPAPLPLHPCDQFDGVAERSTGDELQQGRQRRQLGRWRSGRDTVHERDDLGFVSARGASFSRRTGGQQLGSPTSAYKGIRLVIYAPRVSHTVGMSCRVCSLCSSARRGHLHAGSLDGRARQRPH